MTERRIIRSLGELTSPQVRAVLDKAEIKATGTCSPPAIDLDAIKSRADKLDPKSQLKADVYLLLIEVERLTHAGNT